MKAGSKGSNQWYESARVTRWQIILLIPFPPGQGYAETESWKDGYRGPMRCQCWSPTDFVPLPELNCILIIYINTDRIWFMIIFLIHILFCNTLLPYIVLRSEWCLDTSSCFKYILRFSPAALAPKPGRHRGWWVWWSKMYMFHRLLSLVTMMYNEHDQLTMCHPDWRWLYDCNM